MSPKSSPFKQASLCFCAAALSFGLQACVGASPPAYKTAGSIDDDAPRKPDGVAIDPATASYAPREKGRAEDGFVALHTPLGVDLALGRIKSFFAAVLSEDDDALGTLFTRDAIAITGGNTMGMGSTPAAMLWWEQRFRRLDYGKIAGEAVYRESEIFVFRAGDVLESPPHRAIRTETLNDSDIIIQVPIATARSGQERFFADEIIFWLRREGAQYKIFRVLEEFQIP